MEIENEDKSAVNSVADDEEEEQEQEQNNGEVQQKRTRGRRRKQQQGWEETIDVIIPKCATNHKSKQTNQKEQKSGKKKMQSGEMEIEEQGSHNSSENYKDTVKQMQRKSGHYQTIFNISEYYNMVIDTARFDIQRENFEHLIGRVTNIISQKMNEVPNFLNYIQLLIEKSHLDFLVEFNKQLEYDISILNESSPQTIHIITYQGGNQLFKILTHFKTEIESLIDVIPRSKPNQKPEVILCLFDGSYNISKQDMIDIGKFCDEEYDQYHDRFQIVFIFPISQLIAVPDIQIYTIEFCKSKDLFVKFLLFLLKSEEYPPLPSDLLRRMVSEFDLYQITYTEQVRRIKLAVSTFLFEHQHNEELISLLCQMKEFAQQQLAGNNEDEDEEKSDKDEDEKDMVEEKPKQMRKRGNIVNKNKKQQKPQSHHHGSKTIMINKVDLWTKKKEIKAIISFLESLYQNNFSKGKSNQSSFSQSSIDTSHRLIEIILNKDKKYAMPEAQSKEFFKNPDVACKTVGQLLVDLTEDGLDGPLFKSHIKTIEQINEIIQDDLDKLKRSRVSSSTSDRYAKTQQMKQVQTAQSTNNTEQIAQMKKLKVEEIIKQIIAHMHQSFSQIVDVSKLKLDSSQLNAQCKPDMLGSIMMHQQNNEPTQIMKKKEITSMLQNNSDGMNLLALCKQYGKKFQIGEAFGEFSSFMRENNISDDAETVSASFYNAICELRYLGLIEERRKLKNEFIKHFFAKASFVPMNIQNN